MMLLAGLFAVLAGCAQVLAGALTAGQALLLTPDQEVALGREAAAEYLGKNRAVAFTAVQDEVKRVGKAVAEKSSQPGRPYDFTAVATDDVNAFALPGGPIFVTSGLLARLGDEAQLAGVLAHEVAHVAERHGIARLREVLVLQGIAIAALGNQSELLQRAAGITLSLIVKGRDRGSEQEADVLGIRWMASAGYDPRAMVDTLKMFREIGDVPGFLVWASDHPALADRIALADQQIAAEGLLRGTRDADRYKKAMADVSRP
ncbi:MAG: M48 family metalloprotease [Candidatus Sericytochromatia bacterium]|uniref:M48 family metalloprotease n=1 Tax=Candidatus Tanganyikabacteria bacterium TaxID=2961651 RepID=A0A938BMU8_9BACT|nr:M48 family metalloprotease [Candidatus Tanganyikabacteria bacterium]